MVAAVNDLSFGKIFPSKQEAVKKVRQWMNVCKKIEAQESTAITEICSLMINTSVEIAPGYPFIQLIKEFQTQDERRYLMHLLTNLSKPESLPESPFCINGEESYICSWAKNGVIVSLESNVTFGQPTLKGEISSQKISIKNISRNEHIALYEESLGIRHYEANKKHGKQPYLSAGGYYVDAMDLDDNEAQKLLNRAVEIDGNLYGKRKGQYYCFQRHLNNCYHGYQNNELKLHIKNRIDAENWE